MKSFLLGGIVLATTLMIQHVPASAQGVYGVSHQRIGHSYAVRSPTRSQYHAHRHGPGYGIGAGAAAVAAGALIGGAIASQNQGYYSEGTYPVYSDPGYVYNDGALPVYNDGGSVAYCEQTYRSYDPASGTYLGYDGIRHPCP